MAYRRMSPIITLLSVCNFLSLMMIVLLSIKEMVSPPISSIFEVVL